jgi:hypothetical protein
MPNQTWTYDAPTGSYKQRFLSKKLYEAAVAECVWMDHTKPVEGFGKKMGERVTLTRVGALAEPASAALVETQRIPEDQFVLSVANIAVQEWGRSVPFTSLANDLSAFDLENPIQSTLRDQMQLALDTMCAAAAKLVKVKYVPTGAATNNITTNGTPGAAATSNWNMFHVEEIADYLYDTLKAPYYEGEEYVAIVRTLGLRGIKRDSAWAPWYQYTNPSIKFNGEDGKLERIRFMKTNHAAALGKIGTASVLGEGIVFGKDFLAFAEALTPELRAAIPQDYGRQKGVAWYGIVQAGLIWDTGNAGECRGVHVSST